MPHLFHSRDITYRRPFGAVAEHTEVYFRICLPRDWGCHGAELVMQPDACHPVPMGMFWAGMAGETHEYWDIRYTPDTAGIYWYHFRLQLAEGTAYLVRQQDGSAACHDAPSATWQLTCYRGDLTTPDWLAGGILYQIFPDRFACSHTPKADVPTDRVMHRTWEEEPEWRPDEQGRIRNNDFFGGDLKGIESKLDYLAALGVTCLYLNPIFESHSNHRYDTADYTRVDPLLGGEQDLRDLCTAAAQRGIRVLLDGVFSHTGSDSVYFNREGRYPTVGAYNAPDSSYAPWYQFKCWPNDYESWWGFQTLPEVNELSPAFMEYINGEEGIVARWMATGVAGWRLDVADELPDGFLDALRCRAKTTRPDALILGEVWEDASNKESYGHRRRYLLGQQLDSVMNYPFRRAILDFLTVGGGEGFFHRVMDVVENYPPQALRLLMNHIGTHDTERVLTLLGGEPTGGRGRSWQAEQKLSAEQRRLGLQRLRLATLLQYALPGVPSIYYGDEAGVEGYKDPFNRGTYPWGQEDAELVAWYRRLGDLRHRCSAFAHGEILPVFGDEDTVCFARRDGGTTMICAVNRSERPKIVPLPSGVSLSVVLGDGSMDGTVLHLPPLSGAWLM